MSRAPRLLAVLACFACFEMATASTSSRASAAPPASGKSSEAIAKVDRALAEWDVGRADALVTALVRDEPRSPEAAMAAARVAFFESDYARAIEHGKRAAQLAGAGEEGKDARDFVAYLEERKPSWSSFVEARSEHFVFRHAPRDAILVSYALPALEAALEAMKAELGYVPDRPIVVEMYPTRRAFIAASTLTTEEVETSGTLAICHFNRLMVLSPGVLSRGYEWLDTLCHELIHYAVYRLGADTIPVWLHEGIAKHLETRWRSETPLPLDPRMQSVLAEGLEAGKWVTFAQMHPSMAKLPSAELVSLAFSEVAVTAQMLRSQHGKDALPRFVAAVRAADGDIDKALAATFNLRVSELEERVKTHARGMGLQRVPGLRVFDGKAEPDRLVFADEPAASDPEADAKSLEDRKARDFTILGDRLKGRGMHAAAVIEYDKALARLGMAEPIVVNKKAHALLLLGDPAAALPVLEEALPHAPDLALTLENLSETRLRLAKSAGDAAASEQHARAALEMSQRAERINPFSTDTHLRLVTLHERFGNSADAARARERLALLKAGQ